MARPSSWLNSVTSGLTSQPVPARTSGPWTKRPAVGTTSISGFTEIWPRTGDAPIAYVANEADADLFIAALTKAEASR